MFDSINDNILKCPFQLHPVKLSVPAKRYSRTQHIICGTQTSADRPFHFLSAVNIIDLHLVRQDIYERMIHSSYLSVILQMVHPTVRIKQIKRGLYECCRLFQCVFLIKIHMYSLSIRL